MACFLVPGSEGIVTTLLTKIVGRERARRWRLRWLNTLLWGGTILLAVEHIWHGEVVPWPPFLTAMSNPTDTAMMFHEMATNGVAMASVITMIWAAVVYVSRVVIPTRIMKIKRAKA